MLIQENVPLAPLTTMKVGGYSRYLAAAQTRAEVLEGVGFSRAHNLPLFVLGGGSNVIVSDRGWPGITLKIDIPGIEETRHGDAVIFRVGAGEEWDKFVAHAVARSCAGVECLSGIPGSVGATPVQNVGAYGQEVSDTIQSVFVLDLHDMKIMEFSNKACQFSYRTSIFNTAESGRYIILEVTYKLTPDGEPCLRYADIKNYFSDRRTTPTLSEVRHAVRHIRAGKGMLIEPGENDCRSAGSFFKNPVLTAEQYEELSARAKLRGLKIHSYPALEAHHKVSAAWLVEHSGFARGHGSGPAGISRKHTLAIVNRGNATAADIVELKTKIQERVSELWGIQLQSEPVFVGF